MSDFDFGPKPELAWIKINDLTINDTYQREISGARSQALIKKIANNFHWSKFQPPTLTKQKDGKHIIIDGQHRVAAAKLTGIITEIPAYIVDTDYILEEAESFIAINKDRQKMHAVQLYHARLAAAEPLAIALNNILTEVGVTIPKTPKMCRILKHNETQAIVSLEKSFELCGEKITKRVLQALCTAYKDETGSLSAHNIKTLCRFTALYEDQLDLDTLTDFLETIDMESLKTSARSYTEVQGGALNAAYIKVLETKFNAYTKQKCRGAL